LGTIFSLFSIHSHATNDEKTKTTADNDRRQSVMWHCTMTMTFPSVLVVALDQAEGPTPVEE
jgi:hypothetical protein